MFSSTKCIYVDLAGVQYDFQTGINSFVEKQGVSYQDFGNQVAEAEEQANRGVLPVEKLIETYNRVLGLHLTSKEEYFELWTRLFQPILPVHDLIKKLSQKYTIGIITNIHKGLFEKLQEKKLLADIQYTNIIQSFKIYHVKPEKEIYVLAQEKAMVLPEEIVFIDDNRLSVQTAKGMGWQGIIFDQKNMKSFEKELQYWTKI